MRAPQICADRYRCRRGGRDVAATDDYAQARQVAGAALDPRG
ncbi:MAG TPA: hypothetical protein PLT68_00380 [Actinomycetota bacterium]|nr:hypothetical protein [Actinomycetota bacterium]